MHVLVKLELINQSAVVVVVVVVVVPHSNFILRSTGSDPRIATTELRSLTKNQFVTFISCMPELGRPGRYSCIVSSYVRREMATLKDGEA